MSYHTREIEKGVLGEFSKIREEFEELEDAVLQGDSILTLCVLLIPSFIVFKTFFGSEWNICFIDLKVFK